MSDTDSTEHDDMLFNMLKECKTLPIFFDHIFGFLQRRTDFYHVTTDPNSPIGLPDGLAEHLVRHAYLKCIPKNKDEIIILQESEIPQAIVEEEVVMTEYVEEEILNGVENINLVEDFKNEVINETLQTNLKYQLNTDFTTSESFNGAVQETYCWSQTIGDVDITLKVPESISSKNLRVSILTHKLSVKTQDNVILLEGELCQKCKHNDAIWSLDKKKLQIHLDKCKEIWWDCLLTSESRLDLSTLDCSRPFEDLPEDAQAKIEELGWNQERKRLGLPTSNELVKEELLRKAWNAEGSPFSGPFDPNQVIFQ